MVFGVLGDIKNGKMHSIFRGFYFILYQLHKSEKIDYFFGFTESNYSFQPSYQPFFNDFKPFWAVIKQKMLITLFITLIKIGCFWGGF